MPFYRDHVYPQLVRVLGDPGPIRAVRKRIIPLAQLAERQRRRTELDIAFLDLPGERIPLEDGSVDTVVSTFTLCTIPGVAEALRGVRRVLKPGGKLFFFEHGLSPDPRVRRWQEWSEPISPLALRRLSRDEVKSTPYGRQGELARARAHPHRAGVIFAGRSVSVTASRRLRVRSRSSFKALRISRLILPSRTPLNQCGGSMLARTERTR
jgi:SAM-dependent methyltransferase